MLFLGFKFNKIISTAKFAYKSASKWGWLNNSAFVPDSFYFVVTDPPQSPSSALSGPNLMQVRTFEDLFWAYWITGSVLLVYHKVLQPFCGTGHFEVSVEVFVSSLNSDIFIWTSKSAFSMSSYFPLNCLLFHCSFPIED